MTIGRPAARGGMLVVLVAAALVTAGCTGAPAEPVPTPTFIDLEAVDVAGSERNGIQYLEGPQALGVVLDAMRSAAPVRMTGSYARSADDEVGVTAGSVAVDYVGTSSASRIELIVDGRAVSIVVVGPDAAIGENGAWTCVPAGGSQLRAFAPFTSPTELVEAFFGDGSGAAVSAPTGDPLRLELLLGAADGTSGALTVSAVGAPLPSRIVAADVRSSAEFVFSEWGTETEVALPDAC